MMTTDFSNRMKARIAGEMARLERRIASLSNEERPEESETAGDNTPFTDDADAMLAMEEDWQRASRLDRLIERERALREAMRRIEDGSYGKCAACDARIEPTRLLAVPETGLCVDCQEQIEHPERGKAPQAKSRSAA
jgi:RNA polymerase-binding transcription factor